MVGIGLVSIGRVSVSIVNKGLIGICLYIYFNNVESIRLFKLLIALLCIIYFWISACNKKCAAGVNDRWIGFLLQNSPVTSMGVKSDVNFIFILELLKKYVLYLYHIIWKHNMFHCCCCCYDITGGGNTLYVLLEISQNVSEFWKVTYMVVTAVLVQWSVRETAWKYLQIFLGCLYNFMNYLLFYHNF